jgi:hypothetical protein
MTDDPNITSDAENQALLDAFFDAMVPFAETFMADNPPWQARISEWPGDARTRLLELLGNIAWEIFSNNNEVVGPEGKVYDLGSWRGTGGTIADFLNDRMGEQRFDYIDFYMGLMSDKDDALRPLYTHSFEILKERGCDWRYAPPAIYLLSFAKETDDPATYDPGKAVRENLEETKMWAELNEMNRETYRKAVENPPAIVRAYEEVFGKKPGYIRR